MIPALAAVTAVSISGGGSDSPRGPAASGPSPPADAMPTARGTQSTLTPPPCVRPPEPALARIQSELARPARLESARAVELRSGDLAVSATVRLAARPRVASWLVLGGRAFVGRRRGVRGLWGAA